MRTTFGIYKHQSYSEFAQEQAKIWRNVAKIYEPKKVKPRRKNFRKQAQKAILLIQNYECARCLIYLKYPEFHHKDGDPSNNHISNCEALCPNCHAEITRTPIQHFLTNFSWM